MMKKFITVYLLWICLSNVVVIGCNTKHDDEACQLPEIGVSKYKVVIIEGESEVVIADAIPKTVIQPNFQWHSADDNIATVLNGKITGIKKGETEIIVSCGDINAVISVSIIGRKSKEQYAILYEKPLNNRTLIPELLLNGVGEYDEDGLTIKSTDNYVRLDKFYAIAERKVQYVVKLSADAKAVFRSSEGDFNAYVDVPNKCIYIATYPAIEQKVDFIEAGREYLIEVYHIYQKAKFRIIDIETGKSAEVEAVNDGQGGAGKGIIQSGFSVGMQWDYYCFGLAGGAFMQVKKIAIMALKNKVKMLIYGDSITQPEAYFPTKDFPLSWTQQVINKMKGNAVSSGRGGAQIDMLLNYIKNELPYIKTKYVMVTIGTNGGNTEANLSALISYVKEHGAIPILNNIPSNESGTQIENSKLIEKIREEFGIKGCKFDLATSINGDGKKVDESLMYWEDYSESYGWQIYHHPNEKGGQKMFERTQIDIPEIYK